MSEDKRSDQELIEDMIPKKANGRVMLPPIVEPNQPKSLDTTGGNLQIGPKKPSVSKDKFKRDRNK